ncbi:TPA: hypothetical protein EYN98_16060 [Candidatus Poribacteria bacterium]|nr:hypothetical protein [Candidatus Poribacteria bacterium]
MDNAYLLNDSQIQQFITDGYLQLHVDCGSDFHQQIYQKIESMFAGEGNVGNNILPRVPKIQQVFEHPVLQGALISLLGESYTMNPHRHCHLNAPGGGGQRWHKDCYVFDHNIRHPRFHWVLAFYYPQDTNEEMGPTALLPGMHFCKSVSNDDPEHATEPEVLLCGKAGTVTLVHFDAWHRATANRSAKKRYMLKFQFARMQEPRQPSWDHQQQTWESDQRDEVAEDVWNWLGGGTNSINNGSYQPDLIHAMQQETLASIEETIAKTPDNLHGTNPTAGEAAQKLSVIGSPTVLELTKVLSNPHWWVRAMAADVLTKIGLSAKDAVPTLVERANDDHWWVRRNAIEALGTIGSFASSTVDLLGQKLADPDYRVRRNAAISLAKSGSQASPVISMLTTALNDEDRYNRFYAALALQHIGTNSAKDILLDALFTARWCPITTVDNLY